MIRSPSLALLFLALSALPAGAQAVDSVGTSLGSIEGRIYGRRWTRVAPLSNALVTVTTGRQTRTVVADSLGSYAFSGLDSGMWRIGVQHVGYETITAEVQVPPEGVVTLDLEVEWKPVVLPALLVEVHPVEARRNSEPTSPAEMGEVSLRALEGGPGMVEGGLAQVVRTLPGHDPADPRDVLLMRGSATDLKLVLLDGAPIYAPFHMAGLVESFDPLALGGASLFLGGAPARFDGGLSYILDLKSRSPRRDRVRGNAAADLLTARAFLEGPVTSSTGFLLGSRAIHDLGTPLLDQGPSPYGFGEVLGRLEWQGDGDATAFVTAFWNQEKVNLDLSSLAALAPDQGGAGTFREVPPGDAAVWGNRALVAGIRGPLDQTTAELRVAASRYDAELPVGDTIPLFAKARTGRVRVTADFSKPWGEGSIRWGASLDRHDSDYSAMALDSTRAPITTEVGLEGTAGGVYLEGSRPLTPGLRLRGGIRLDRFSEDSGIRAAPRASLTWMLTENAALTLAAGVYHQFSGLEVGEVQKNLEPGGTDSPTFGGEPLKLTVGSANHLVVSLDQILRPGLRLGLEGFVKDFSGVPSVNNQKLRASGVDLRVAREGERAAGWFGYTLTWLWASDGIVSSGNSPFSGRHLLSAGLTARLTERTGLRLRTGYGDGLPYTSVDLPLGEPGAIAPDQGANARHLESSDKVLNEAPELTVGPDEGFLRVEAEIYGIWNPSLGGRAFELRPYIRVLNALNRRDALFYHFDPYRNEGPEPLADLPILPLVGFEIFF